MKQGCVDYKTSFPSSPLIQHRNVETALGTNLLPAHHRESQDHGPASGGATTPCPAVSVHVRRPVLGALN